ncbi:hypothetical protein BUZ57_06690 [Staphylococcus hyicus]|uniref:Lipoprotein n=1 Tax=Staphylococcus hyicus TaxID=1284 RepID=A0A418JIQ8_STAHY|nr:membrane lipoprotein lipid attachment site-containing protein [Staphylococcus hyicus]MCQ9301298.1 membrane lipoprotein lipid attachment site-containing protein [Staphylococcus hyicus]NJH81885.1 hypothetical protein [Staphylococcus hyicus]RIO45698.1 hypothetical protein BUZ57_06690 [Staphylococcus hyicus]
MKKILFVLFASLLVLSACGNNSEKESKEKSSNSSIEKKKEKNEDKKAEKKEKKQDNKTNEESQTSYTTQNPSEENTTFNNHQQSIPVENNQSQNDQWNTNLNGDVVVAPGWTEQQQKSEYEKYKEGQMEQIQRGIEPGAQITHEEQIKENIESAN